MTDAFDKLKNNSYSAAEEKAWEDLVHLDSRSIAKNSLADFDGRNFTLTVLDEMVKVDKWEGRVTSSQPHDKFFDILVIHYLVGCQASGPEEEPVLFRQLKGGEAYNNTFQKRVNDRLAKVFGNDPSSLVRAGMRLNGKIKRQRIGRDVPIPQGSSDCDGVARGRGDPGDLHHSFRPGHRRHIPGRGRCRGWFLPRREVDQS